MKKLLILIATLVLTTSIKAQVKPDTLMYAVLNIDSMRHSWSPNSDYRAVGLTGNELIEVETILKKSIDEYNISTLKYYDSVNQTITKPKKKIAAPVIDLAKYRIQFIPALNSKEEKKVWVYCFCSKEEWFKDWRREVILVPYGGYCFFHLTINLTTKKSSALRINSRHFSSVYKNLAPVAAFWQLPGHQAGGTSSEFHPCSRSRPLAARQRQFQFI